jgi:sigma-E factor negative regulatory protein RseC
MEETGIVEELKPNGFALVRATSGNSCESCKARGACHALGGGTERRVTALNRVGAAPGDQVLMTIGTGSFLKASFIVYLFPVLALVVGSLLGEKYSDRIWPARNPETVAVVMGLLSLVVSFLLIRLFSRRAGQSEKYYPVIERVISPSRP